MRQTLALVGIILGTLVCHAAGAKPEPAQAVLDKMGLEATRMADADYCFPANADEYEALARMV